MTNIAKETGEIWTRLFDHRPFLNGEIKHFVREFEEKRGDREIENLFAVLENIADLKGVQVPKVAQYGKTNLPDLDTKLDKALQVCNRIEERQKRRQKANEEYLIEGRAKREQEWSHFTDDIVHKYQRVNNAFEEKEEELRDFYTDLEHKLKITT